VCDAHKWIDTSYINKCSIQSHRRWRRDREDAERERERWSFQEISEREKWGERGGFWREEEGKEEVKIQFWEVSMSSAGE
jgi:hypothetical protein